MQSAIQDPAAERLKAIAGKYSDLGLIIIKTVTFCDILHKTMQDMKRKTGI